MIEVMWISRKWVIVLPPIAVIRVALRMPVAVLEGMVVAAGKASGTETMSHLSTARAAFFAATSMIVASSISASATPMSASTAPPAVTSFSEADAPIEQAQYRRGYYGPRSYGGPRFYGGPRYYRAPGPVYAYRPWYRRPYYGTIIGGVALGSILAVTAYGLAPRAPRPDLCWYWADEIQSRGYWDYC